jgi:hypothetical protein
MESEMKKIIPGFRLFRCDTCNNEWKYPCRDCYSSSGDSCRCGDSVYPLECEEHPEWPVDVSGNIINEEQYENKN